MIRVSTELLIVGVQKNCDHIKGWPTFVSFYGEQLENWIRSGDIDTNQKKLTTIPYVGKNNELKRVLFVGLGDTKTLTETVLRETFGLVGKELKRRKECKFTIWLESFTAAPIDEKTIAYLFAEGTGLGYYTIPNYKTTSNEVDVYLEEVQFITDADIDEIAASYEVGKVYADAVNEARNLMNLPPNLCTSTDLANYAQTLRKAI